MTMIKTINGLPPSATIEAGRAVGTTGTDFAHLLSSVMSDTIAAMQTAEATASKALTGDASIQQVVESVMNAERQLQTVLALRDKVVAAYLEINRTNI